MNFSRLHLNLSYQDYRLNSNSLMHFAVSYLGKSFACFMSISFNLFNLLIFPGKMTLSLQGLVSPGAANVFESQDLSVENPYSFLIHCSNYFLLIYKKFSLVHMISCET